jgi:hypothetical protein
VATCGSESPFRSFAGGPDSVLQSRIVRINTINNILYNIERPMQASEKRVWRTVRCAVIGQKESGERHRTEDSKEIEDKEGLRATVWYGRQSGKAGLGFWLKIFGICQTASRPAQEDSLNQTKLRASGVTLRHLNAHLWYLGTISAITKLIHVALD